MKTPFFCLLTALTLSIVDVGRACEYCRMAAEDPEAARLALAAHAATAPPAGGAFPLQGTINQFKADAPASVLTAPPSSVATSAADLPARLPAAPRPAVPAAPVTVARPSITKISAPAPPANRSVHWADAGLLGVFGFLGFFGWRTRANVSPRSDR